MTVIETRNLCRYVPKYVIYVYNWTVPGIRLHRDSSETLSQLHVGEHFSSKWPRMRALTIPSFYHPVSVAFI